MASWREKIYAAVGQTPPPEKKESAVCEKCGHAFMPDGVSMKWCRGCIQKADATIRAVEKSVTKAETPLTDEQIENWRKALCISIGPYALIMPKEEVQKLHDVLQRRLDKENT
jgi:hypothetical protein